MRYKFVLSQKGEYGKEEIKGVAPSYSEAVKFAEMALAMCADVTIEIMLIPDEEEN